MLSHLGHVLADAAPPPSGGTDRAVLIATLGGIVVTAITGVVAIINNRRQPPADPSPVRYVDPPTSHALPQALSDLYEDAVERAVRCEQEVAVWKRRALDRGWTES